MYVTNVIRFILSVCRLGFMPRCQRKRNVSHYFVFPLVFPLASGWLLLLRLGGARTSGPRNLSRKESGLSSSSTRLLCAQSLRVTTRVTNLAAQEKKEFIQTCCGTCENVYVRICMDPKPGQSSSSSKGVS